MARLRYNGLATGSAGSLTALALGGSLTNSATSVTFNAALTYQNGTAVPTIASPDYIPLTIRDGSGNVSEVVYLTAYTAAATTGTITRGQEGTTGVAHASGDKVIHAPTTYDIDGPPALKPALLHATYGDDFAGSSLDAKWTRVGYVSGDEQYQMGAKTWLQIDVARASGNYYYQTAPGGDFIVVMAMNMLGSGNVACGPMIMDASGNGVAAGCYMGAPPCDIVGTVTAGAYGGSFAQLSGGPNQSAHIGGGGVHWVKLRKVSNVYSTALSINGEVWSPWSGTVTPTSFTPARIGFGSWFGTVGSIAVDWFDVQ